MPDMQGKTVVVTGGNSGIGLETAAALGRWAPGCWSRRATPTRGGRPRSRRSPSGVGGDGAGRSWSSSTWPTWPRCGGGRPRSSSRRPRLDVLVNNAGLVLTERTETVDGYRGHLRHQPSGPVPPDQPAARPARGVGALADRQRGLDGAQRGPQGHALRRPAVDRRYRGMRVYGQSKLANILFTIELARRLEGTGVTANSLHPGTVRTGYGADGDAKGLLAFGIKIASPVLPVAGQGGADVGLPGLVARGGGRERGVLRQVQAEEAAQAGPGCRRGATAVAGQRAAGRPAPAPGELSRARPGHRGRPRHRPGHGRGAGRPGPRGGGHGP